MERLKHLLLKGYVFLFARRGLYKFNRRLYLLSLHGMGILNSLTPRISGEAFFLKTLFRSRYTPRVVFDVGAHKGHYARMVRRLSPDAQVYAFEPHPATFKILQECAREYRFTAFPLGISDTKGKLTLYDHADRDGSSHASFYKTVIEELHGHRAVQHQVEVTTLDDFAATHGVERIDLLKIDTEGNELRVLQGAGDLLRAGKIEWIQFEFNETHLISRVYLKDFMDLLPEYDFWRLLPNGAILLNGTTPVHREIFAYQNIVACKKGSALIKSMHPFITKVE